MRVRSILPGLLPVVVLAGVAYGIAWLNPLPVGAIIIGVLLGLIVSQLVELPERMQPGIRFATKSLLPLGIVFLGARLSFQDVIETGLGALAIVSICISVALALTVGVGRMLGLPPRLCLLIGVGTAICGNSAIVATAPVVEADDRDVSYAVATITAFGTAAVFVYPLIGQLVGMSDQFFGYWAGAAVNDTAQVVAAGYGFSEPAGETATVVKLTRNTLMGPLIVLLGILYLRSTSADSAAPAQGIDRRHLLKAVPLFVIGFLAMAILNSLSLFPAGSSELLGEISGVLILAALVGVGLSTNLRQMRRTGLKPFALGLVVSVTLSVLALVLTTVIIA